MTPVKKTSSHLAVLILFCAQLLSAQSTSIDISRSDLELHVKYLASDELEGRRAGTEGNRKAADYIARQFERFGLSPAGTGGSFFQPFEFVASVRPGDGNALSFSRPDGLPPLVLTPDTDFRPFGFSSNTTISAPVVFAGYGISAPDENYDDFKDLDVSGKIIVVLRYTPEGSDPHASLNRHSALRNKARTARDKGATGLIMITGPLDEEEDSIIKLSYDQSFSTSGIPAVTMKRAAFEDLLMSSGKDLKTIQEELNNTKQPQSFPIPSVTATLSTEVVKVTATTSNIVGYLEGTHPEKKNEVLVIGAHMDHLGYGGPGSGSITPDTQAIHNGADDNASGTSALIELAEAIGHRKHELERSVVFIAFSAEEIGLLGSTYYVNNPFVPLATTVAMLNMDMVGRLEDNTLTVHGTGTSSLWNDLLKHHNMTDTGTEKFTLKYVADGFGPSDHAQFYGKDIPVLFFFTGTHSDYHRPSDDWDKLNYAGHEQVTKFVDEIAMDLIKREDRPDFKRVQMSSPMASGGDSRGFTVTLGIIPDYAEGDEGMKIGGLRPQGPAEKAGIKSGDIITRMAGKTVLNIYDYMGILGELKTGQEVEVEVKRDGQQMVFTAKMEKRQ